MNIPHNLLRTDWDQQASRLLSSSQLEVYRARSQEARKKWETAQTVYSHLTRNLIRSREVRTWSLPERQAAAHFLEFQQALWSLLMQIRVGQDQAKPSEGP